MIRSIPPGIRAGNRKRVSLGVGNIKSHNIGSSENFSAKKGEKMGMHDYQKMGTSTLEDLLIKAYELEGKMKEAIIILASDENQLKLEKLQLIIEKLKQQIESRG